MDMETIEQIIIREIREKEIAFDIYLDEVRRLNEICSQLQHEIKELYYEIE